jgi:hypothetical protein
MARLKFGDCVDVKSCFLQACARDFRGLKQPTDAGRIAGRAVVLRADVAEPAKIRQPD